MEIIRITVSGPVACGKTAIMQIIESAIKDHYGLDTQVASHELQYERRVSPNGDAIKAAKETGVFGSYKNRVFVISEVVEK